MERPRYRLIRPNTPEPNPALLFSARVVVACVVAACAWTGFAAAEPVDTLPVGTGRDGEVDDEEPGLWWIGIGYKYLLDNYTEFQIAWIGSFVLHEVAYFGAYIPWLIIDNIPYCRRYKIQVTEYNPPVKQWECFKKLMFAHVFVQFPLMAFFHIVAIEIEDFYFYWVHRLLHHRRIYKYIHKVHHHYAAPFGITAEYAHPIETLFLGLGTLLGPMFFARHLLTVWVWLVFRLYETIEDHSGYILPWYFNPTSLIPFWGGADHHDFHHEHFDCNYADVFTIWDTVFGTDKQWRKQHSIGRLNNKGRAEYEASLKATKKNE